MQAFFKVVLSTAVLAVVTATAGCGGGDSKAACDAITAELTNVTSAGMRQISDPQGLAKTYNDGAAKVRSEGAKAGGDVQGAADSLATAMEELGRTVGAGSGQIPDGAALTNASIKVKQACS